MDISKKIEAIYEWFDFCVKHPENQMNVFDPIKEEGTVYLSSGWGWLLLVAAIISLVVAIVYYLVIDHPRFKSWWSWLIMLAVNFGLCLFAGWLQTKSRVGSFFEIKDEDIKFQQLAEQLKMPLDATASSFNCLGMGLANAFVSIILFTLFSCVLMWFSRNAKYSPLRA